MDIRKLKNFVYFKLPFCNPRRPPKNLKGTLKEVRVFNKATLDPACPICESLLENHGQQFQQSPDAEYYSAANEDPNSGQVGPLNPSRGWWCSTCATPVIFNEDP